MKTYVWLGLAVLGYVIFKQAQSNQAVISSDPLGLAASKPPSMSQSSFFSLLSGI